MDLKDCDNFKYSHSMFNFPKNNINLKIKYEVKDLDFSDNSADILIYWGWNPLKSHCKIHERVDISKFLRVSKLSNTV